MPNVWGWTLLGLSSVDFQCYSRLGCHYYVRGNKTRDSVTWSYGLQMQKVRGFSPGFLRSQCFPFSSSVGRAPLCPVSLVLRVFDLEFSMKPRLNRPSQALHRCFHPASNSPIAIASFRIFKLYTDTLPSAKHAYPSLLGSSCGANPVHMWPDSI